MTSIKRTTKILGYLLFLSSLFFLQSCSNIGIYSEKKHETHNITYDVFNTQTSKEPSSLQSKKSNKIEYFIANTRSTLNEFEQLEQWFYLNCSTIEHSWQACLQSISLAKNTKDTTLQKINNLENTYFKNFLHAIYLHNKAELLITPFSDRKHKIQSAELMIQSHTIINKLLSSKQNDFYSFYEHLIKSQLHNLVIQDNFLTVLISKPEFSKKDETQLHYSILDWTINILNHNYKSAKSVRKNNPFLENNQCLINIEQAYLLQNKLNKKHGTVTLKKLNQALQNTNSTCKHFDHSFYLFSKTFLRWADYSWDIFDQFQTQPTLTQHLIIKQANFNNKKDIYKQYLSEQPNDIFIYFFNALKLNSITADNSCFKLNKHFINCYQLLPDNQPIKQLNNREFLIDQLVYVFPYELLIHQLKVRENLHKDQLNISLNSKEQTEIEFTKRLKTKLVESQFSIYQLKLLYAHYAILNLSDSFLSEQDKVKITNFFFTQEGYQLKWEFTQIVQSCLTQIQLSHHNQLSQI